MGASWGPAGTTTATDPLRWFRMSSDGLLGSRVSTTGLSVGWGFPATSTSILRSPTASRDGNRRLYAVAP